jgi:hypothetical protein
MSNAIVKSLIDEQVEDAEQRVQVRGVVQLTRAMLVADLKHPIKADWLKRRPMPRPTPCQ